MRYKILSIFFYTVSFINAQIVIDTNACKKVTIINEKEINSEHLEYCPVLFEDYIMFVKSNKANGKDKNIDDYFHDLAIAAPDKKDNLSKHAFLSKVVNSTMHEGQAVYDQINKKFYFTRSFYNEEKGTRRDTIVLKIYETNFNEDFDEPKPLSFCNDKYNVCHPTLNKRGDFMIFSSNMPGSQGMDLYSVTKSANKWGTPEKIEFINSPKADVFPYLFRDSLLIFSSDRDGGMGGLDFYFSSLTDTGWVQPVLLPFPVNSSFDEIGLLLLDNGKKAYFSTNRPEGKGKDDIYRIVSNVPLIRKAIQSKEFNCLITVMDKLSFKGLNNVEVFIQEFDKDKISIAGSQKSANKKEDEFIIKYDANMPAVKVVTKGEGKESINLNYSKTYIVKAKVDGYEIENLLYSPAKDGNELTIVMNPKSTEIVTNNPPTSKEVLVIPTEVGKSVVFNNIYYEYGKSIIKADAALELDILFDVMKSNPGMRIQLSSHTDSRGNVLYNRQLSEERAKSAKNYLVNKGIAPNRIVTIGFGESRIRNHCLDGVACSEEEHQYNRRTEVLVIE